MYRAVVGLGGNMGDRAGYLLKALASLDGLCGTRVLGLSGIYETAPVGLQEQPDFLNGAALLETALSPRLLLGACLGIEAALGRVRQQKNGPRIIDLDLLLYEGALSDDPELTLPHPRMAERLFVLRPLLDLFSRGTALGFPFSHLLKAHNTEDLRAFSEFKDKFDKYRKIRY